MKPHQLPARVAKRIEIKILASQGYSQRQIVKNLKVLLKDGSVENQSVTRKFPEGHESVHLRPGQRSNKQ